MRARRGHFRHESGHHGDLWLELDLLLVDARRVHAWAAELAGGVAGWGAEVVCGPLTGGAFVAHALAAALGVGFAFAERRTAGGGVEYRVPAPLHAVLRGRRVLVVDDAVNAGSALVGTLDDVARAGGVLVGAAALLALGDAGPRIAAARGLPWRALARLERGLWEPAACPLCAAGGPVEVDPVRE